MIKQSSKTRNWGGVLTMFKSIPLALVMCMGVGASVAQAQSYDTSYFSEENADRNMNKGECTSGIVNMMCEGSNCDNIALTCAGIDPITETLNSAYSGSISDERPNNSYTCPPQQIAVGVKCDGGNCDNVSVQCAITPRHTVSNCAWEGEGRWFSEENGRSKNMSYGKYMAGLKCWGGQCDNKQIYSCNVEKTKVDIAKVPDGDWVGACAGGAQCKSTIKESLNIGNLDKNTWTKETQQAVSLAITAGVSYSAGSAGGVEGGASTTVTGSTSRTNGNAATIAKSSDQNFSASCQQDIDFEKHSLHKAWQWQVSQRVNDTIVLINTCELACTANGDAPIGKPGSENLIGSCFREGGASVPTKTVISVPTTPTTPAPTPSTEPVTGLNAVAAMHSRGSFKQTGDKSWGEFSSTGQQGFSYREVGRDAWSIYLHDTRRDVQIQIDLFQKKIKYGPKSGPTRDLYTVTGSK